MPAFDPQAGAPMTPYREEPYEVPAPEPRRETVPAPAPVEPVREPVPVP